jgi:hypothetical protein
MKDFTQFLRFLLGGGWWTPWYALFHLVVIGGNFMWFASLGEWTIAGQTGPGAEAIFICLLTTGGIPLLLFSVIHLLLVSIRSREDFSFRLRFAALLISLIILWMVTGPLCIAGGFFPGFLAYYLVLPGFVFANLSLLWVIRRGSSLRLVLPFMI